MSVNSTVFAVNAEQVVYVWEPGTRDPKPGEKTGWTGKVHFHRRTDVVGCTHYDCSVKVARYESDRGKSTSPAVSAWVGSQYGYDRDGKNQGVVFYCKRHTGLYRGLRSRTTGYGDEYLMQVAGERGKNEWVGEDAIELKTVEEVAANPGAFVMAVKAERIRRIAAANKARLDYMRDHRQQYLDEFHSERDGQSYYSGGFKLADADEYDRVYIRPPYSGGMEKLTPARAREVAAKLLALADEAEQATPRS